MTLVVATGFAYVTAFVAFDRRFQYGVVECVKVLENAMICLEFAYVCGDDTHTSLASPGAYGSTSTLAGHQDLHVHWNCACPI